MGWVDSDSNPGLHRSGSVPGDRQPLAAAVPLQGRERYVIGWYGHGDIFRVEVSRANLPLNQMRVGLRTAAPEDRNFGVDWSKEIIAWNIIAERTGLIHLPGRIQNPTTMTIQRAKTTANPSRQGADTIVFRKPGFLGIWKDMYHFKISEFWDLWGGREVIFTWLRD